MSISNLFVPNDYNLYVKSISINNENDEFNRYVQEGYNTTVTGPFTTPVNIGILYRQIDRTYSITVPTVHAATTNAAIITFTVPIPAAVLHDLYFPIWVENNSVIVAGTLKISAGAAGTAVMTAYVGYSTAFTASGNGGFPGFSVTFGSVLTL